MNFNPNQDSIAITLSQFKLKKSSDFGRYNEPYIISIAIDEQGSANPNINFNIMPFPKVRAGETLTMLGHGHLLYGPKNPGEFVALSILIMESDSDIKILGEKVQRIIQSKAVELGIGAIVAANPGYGGMLAVLKELIQLVAGELKENKDDELFRAEGTFLRDYFVPYHVNREYTRGNDYVDISLKVLPLASSNMQGLQPKKISL